MTLSGLHILLAEDNPTNQMVAVQMLECLGATVSLAVDGLEALELAGRERFDLALIDIEMPRLSGTDVIQRLRAGPPPHRDMPLIALTAYVMHEHRAVIEQAGADGLIAKPILSIEQLGEDILRIAARRGGGSPASTHATRPVPREAPGRAAAAADCVDPEIFEALARAIGPAALGDLMEKMDADLLGVREKIATALPSRAAGPIRDATHILVAVAGSVGARCLQNDAQCLNSALHSGEMESVEPLGRQVIQEIDVLRQFIGSKLQG